MLKTAIIRKTTREGKTVWCLFSRKQNPKTGKRRNLGCYPTRAGAQRRERQVQFWKRQGEAVPDKIRFHGAVYVRS